MCRHWQQQQPAVRAGKEAQKEYPAPLFPSGLAEGQTVNSAMHDAVFGNDRTMVERLILGLYGTGADYRTMQIRVYDSISTTFQHAGHPLMFAVRGMQLLDAVEWGDRAPNIIHWLAPHLPLHTEEPAWVNPIRSFLSEPVIALPVIVPVWLLRKKKMRSLYAVLYSVMLTHSRFVREYSMRSSGMEHLLAVSAQLLHSRQPI